MITLNFPLLYAGLNPPTPTIQFTARWQNNANQKGCPLRRDFCIAQGDDFRFIGTVKDSAGVLQDLGGAQEIVFGLYTGQGGTEVHRITLSGGDILIGAPEQYYFSLRNTLTATLTRRAYWHETLITNSDGWRNTVCNGMLRIEKTNIGAV